MSSSDSHGDSAVKRLNPQRPPCKMSLLQCIPTSSKMVKSGSDPTRTLHRKPSEALLSINWPALHPPITLPGTNQELSPSVNLKILKNKKYKTSQVELYLRQDHSSQNNLNQHSQQTVTGHERRLKLGDFLLSDTSMNIEFGQDKRSDVTGFPLISKMSLHLHTVNRI
uniref:Uncharacterized protein n=1 Tax=Cacopsylla melanoneura TaxID=428564 RepID=A0A8D8WVL5_9HEMI